jgi:hypothetical protein
MRREFTENREINSLLYSIFSITLNDKSNIKNIINL